MKARALALGVADRVHFDDVYRDWESLRALVRTADVVLLPYDSRRPSQLRRARRGAGVGQTGRGDSLPHAVELLADGAGILVDHCSPEAMAHALERVLYEDGLAGRMARAARVAATPLLWPAVGAEYCSLVNRVVAARAVM